MNKKYWSQRIQNNEPYVPGEQPKDRKYIKLNTNENPYPPSPKVAEAIQNVDVSTLRLYPDPECTELRKAMAEHFGLDLNQVFIGNGSDEILAFSYLAFMDENNPAVFPDITYSFYPVYASFFQNNMKIIPVDENFNIPLEELKKDIGTVVLTNPNAPTGIAVSPDEIEKILQANPNHVVIVDEAYVDFGADSAVGLINRYDNLLVAQTFSKSRSLAGMRVGCALGNANLIQALTAVKDSINSYTIDRVALAAATAAIKDQAYTDEICGKIRATRERFVAELKKLGFSVLPSKSNFVFASHESFYAGDLFLKLRENGILVRYFKKPRIDNFLRITIGTDEEMNAMLTVLEKLLEA